MPDSDKAVSDRSKARSSSRAATRTFHLLDSLFDWIGRHEASVLIALLVVILAIWLFAVLAGEVIAGDTLRFDESVVRSLRRRMTRQSPSDLTG